ncbi:hypothetical protein MMC17_003779 [Xylographa soralifera]|nr:hypothetical protein [Xylographa soralifera]
MSSSIYTQLLGPLRQFRLLTLNSSPTGPTDPDAAPLVGTLETFAMDNPSPFQPSYAALSYAWGDSTPTASIALSASPSSPQYHVSLSSNINFFLISLRRYTRLRLGAAEDNRPPPELVTLVLWVDAICIDQANEEEQCSQIPLMGTIFGKADQVIGYVGLASSESIRLAFDLLHRLVGIERRKESVAGSEREGIEWSDQKWSKDRMEAAIRADVTPNKASKPTLVWKQWRAFMQLLASTWFSRVWVMQEVALGQDVKILCGEHLWQWEWLEMLVMGITKTNAMDLLITIAGMKDELLGDEVVNQCKRGGLQVLNMAMIRNGRAKGVRSGMLELLGWSRHAAVKDDRDRLRGLMSLATDWDSVDTDSKSSVEEVYATFARSIVRKEKFLTLLYFAGLSRTAHWLPSWVPDWRVERTIDLLAAVINKINNESYYRATSGSEAEWNVTSNTTILVKGYSIDKIVSTGLPFSQVNLATVQQKSPLAKIIGLRDWLLDCTTRANAKIDFQSLSGREEACWRTLIANKTAMDETPPPDMEQKYARCQEYWQRVVSQWQGSEEQLAENWALLASINNDDAAFYAALVSAAAGRRFCVTECGSMGLVPEEAAPGDVVCLLLGGAVPFILRRSNQCWTLIGEAYTHGMMDGEAVPADRHDLENFILH